MYIGLRWQSNHGSGFPGAVAMYIGLRRQSNDGPVISCHGHRAEMAKFEYKPAETNCGMIL